MQKNKRNEMTPNTGQRENAAAQPTMGQESVSLPMDGTVVQSSVDRTYKARLFEMIFSEKTELLQLYNAMNGTDYKDPELLEINTLENAIYMSMHNDLSFIIDSRLTLYEHQSTYSPNLPLRCLMYTAALYSVITRDENLYGSKPVGIPTPRFVIFYNGMQEIEDKTVLKLSDSFRVKEETYSLELIATMLNINPGHNRSLMDSCKTLGDYSEYVAKVREYAKVMSLDAAVDRAISECIRSGILADFLRKNRAEAKSMSIYEYDEEKHMRQVKEEGRLEGLETGRKEGLETGRKEGLETGRKEGLETGRKEGLETGRTEGLETGRKEGFETGRKKGLEAGIKALVIAYCTEGFSKAQVIEKLQEIFSLSTEDAATFYERFHLEKNKRE